MHTFCACYLYLKNETLNSALATKHLSVRWPVRLSVDSTQLSKTFKICSFNNTFPAKAYSVWRYVLFYASILKKHGSHLEFCKWCGAAGDAVLQTVRHCRQWGWCYNSVLWYYVRLCDVNFWCFLCFSNEASRDRFVVGRLVGWLVTNFKKVEMMSCKVYTVQYVYTGQGPGTVHVYTQLWAQHSQK